MEQKPKRIRRDPEKYIGQIRAWKIANRERINEQARVKRADPEKRAHERELEKVRRSANRDERNAARRGNRSAENERRRQKLTADPELAAADKKRKREQMRVRRAKPEKREREQEANVARYAANPERGREYTRKWRAANKAKKAEQNRLYYEKNAERLRAEKKKHDAEKAALKIAFIERQTNKIKILDDEIVLTPKQQRRRAWSDINKEKMRAYHRAHRIANLERLKANRKADYAANTERYRKQAKEWRAANPEEAKARSKAWREANHGKVIAGVKLRKAYIKLRTPTWASLEAIAAFYANCPPGYHVDHIEPLRGKHVSGLHIETNLQYLPGVDNLRKHAKFVSGPVWNEPALKAITA